MQNFALCAQCVIGIPSDPNNPNPNPNNSNPNNPRGALPGKLLLCQVSQVIPSPREAPQANQNQPQTNHMFAYLDLTDGCNVGEFWSTCVPHWESQRGGGTW